jgi:capsular polysaccharide biosynthesis protein
VELKQYLLVLRRRWIPLVIVPAVVALLVLVQALGTEASYTATTKLSVTRAPQQLDIEDFRYDEYHLFLASEFFIDDLVEVVRGSVFAEDVHARVLENHGVDIPPGEVQGSIISERRHRILTIDVTNHDPDRAVLIARAASQQLNQQATKYFGFDNPDRAALVEPIQLPEHAHSSISRDQIFWLLQIMVAVFAGVLLAFLLDYLDDRLYTTEMVERAVELDVIAEVPRGRVT